MMILTGQMLIRVITPNQRLQLTVWRVTTKRRPRSSPPLPILPATLTSQVGTKLGILGKAHLGLGPIPIGLTPTKVGPQVLGGTTTTGRRPIGLARGIFGPKLIVSEWHSRVCARRIRHRPWSSQPSLAGQSQTVRPALLVLARTIALSAATGRCALGVASCTREEHVVGTFAMML